MKLVLTLMIRNESKIIERCLKAVENLVDAFCVMDTGSTDNTCELVEEFLKTHEGCLSKSKWRDFGYNRTLTFEAAQTYVRDGLKWNLEECYGLLLDADMVFVPGTLKEEPLTELGYTIIQCAGQLEYPNCRLVRMDYNWKCRGVTHEYWDGPTKGLPKTVCYIDDRNDGGCKSDKFERDARLLEKGLEDEPTNVRYMFYLAQTYHSLGRWRDSIQMYKKRIAAGGWYEEVWYSHYMIGQCHKMLGNIEKFEEWMLRAYKFHPRRAEPIYKLAEHFRITSQHFKAYHYVKLGLSIPYPKDDSLFVETQVYHKMFEYELTILDYYVFSENKTKGLTDSIKYLMNHHDGNVMNNLEFYLTPIVENIQPIPAPKDLFGQDFHPTSVCVYTRNGCMYANVRYVNYIIKDHGPNIYQMSENGVMAPNHRVRTQNAWWNMETNEFRRMNEDSITIPKRGAFITGVEDVRVFEKKDGLYFSATVVDYAPHIRILYGKYDPEHGNYVDAKVIESPGGPDKPCEKNWLGIPFTDDMIYDWYPLQIGSIEGNELKIHTRHKTNEFFRFLRGSAPPFRVNNELWTLVHIAHGNEPRKYYHLFVVLDLQTYKPLRMCLPFVFQGINVEYCLGACWVPKGIFCVYSVRDNNPAKKIIDPSVLKWVEL